MKVQARCKRPGCRAVAKSETAVRCSKCRGDLAFAVRFQGTNGNQQEKRFGDRKAAEIFIASRTVKISDGTWIDPTRGKVALRDYFAAWIGDVREKSEPAWNDGERGVLARRTVEKYESVFRLYIDPALGRRTLGSLTEIDVEDMAAGIRSPWQADEAVKLVRRILTRAVRAKLVAVNVASHAALRDADRKTAVRVLEAEEVDRIVEAIDDRYRALVRLLYVGALRWSEAIGLRRQDVDVAGRRVQIRRTLNQTRTGSGSFFEGPTKTGKARTVAIDDETAVLLAEHLLAFPPARGDFGELVFTGPKGAALRARVFAKAWKRALAAAGIDEAVRVMWLRHSGLTMLLRATGSPKAVAHHAGHTDTRMMDRIYVKLGDEADQEAVAQAAAWIATRRERAAQV